MLRFDRATQRGAWPRVKALYREAFPREERAPLWLLRLLAKRGASELLAAFDGETFVGLAIVAQHERLRYVFYLAVEAELRGQGYGSAMLEALQARYPDARMCLCMEDPDVPCDNLPQRLRRAAFYARCGYEPTGVRLTEAGVGYALLSRGGRVSYDEYYALMEHYMGRVISRALYRQVQ